MKAICKLLASFLTALLLLPAASAHAESRPVFCPTDFASRVMIANLSDEQIESFHIVDDYLAEMLSDADVTLIDITLDTTRARLDEQMTAMERGVFPPNIAAVRPDYVIYGYLTNLGVAVSKRPGSSVTVVRADLSARVIETATGKQVFTATGSGESAAKSCAIGVGPLKLLRFGTKEFSEECLHEALFKATRQIADKIKAAL